MEVPDITELLNGRNVKLENGDSNSFVTAEEVEFIPEFVETDLGLMQTGTEILPSSLTVFCDQQEEEVVEDPEEEVIVQLMDIRTRLSKLRELVEQRIGFDLSDYTFWLQDAKMLENHKTLVEQCIRGEGVVQVNLQVKQQERKINILDVLKPDEELVQLADEEDMEDIIADCVEEIPETTEETNSSEVKPEQESHFENETRHAAAVRWIVDAQFKSDQTRLNIPEDPSDWSVQHVRLWIQWAVRQFKLSGVKLLNWNISGAELTSLTHAQFQEKVPKDPGDLFWTHFELLRKCKFIAVVQNDNTPPLKDDVPQSAIRKKPKQVLARFNDGDNMPNMVTTRIGNNGQIQLWQFLLELLTSAQYIHLIKWHGEEGEFKLLEPEKVASLWGARKHKPAMNYEKLSRALRYYYDGDMIAKVAGKRFVYKFVCDLQELIGYNAAELSALVAGTLEQLKNQSATASIDL